MFYFKDAPLAPSGIDPDQLRRVAQFRESLGSEGTLHWTFRTLDDFVQLLRIHLSRQIQELAEPGPPPAAAQSLAPAQSTATESDEFGLLDFLDLVDEHFGALREIAARITTETASIGENMQNRTVEIKEATTSAQGQLSRRQARNMIDRAAADMTQYVARMRAEIPLFRDTLQKGADAAGSAVLLRRCKQIKISTQVLPVRGRMTGYIRMSQLTKCAEDAVSSRFRRLSQGTQMAGNTRRNIEVTDGQIDHVGEVV